MSRKIWLSMHPRNFGCLVDVNYTLRTESPSILPRKDRSDSASRVCQLIHSFICIPYSVSAINQTG